MELTIKKQDWLFLLLCLFVGILGEEAFFRGQIGISYFVFIVFFYSIFFWRFRTFPFTHQRLGYLVLIVIWILAASYYLYDTGLFYLLNIFIIPGLVIFHLALITSPKNMKGTHFSFLSYMVLRLFDSIRYHVFFSKAFSNSLKRGRKEKSSEVLKKVLIGILISLPILFIVLNLLIEADTQFERLIGHLPNLLNFRMEPVLRVIIIVIYTFGIFGYCQILLRNNYQMKREIEGKPVALDGIITLTVLVLLDAVYVLFVAVQFTYFFSGTLEDGFTYAEYARRGFFELLFVTLINLSVTTIAITATKKMQGVVKYSIQAALSILVLSSGVLLISAFMRMAMYEAAYGFTFTRVLVHSFMIFLLIILAYTLVKIWLEKLSLFHFYFIAALIYYASINIINIDGMVVERNMARFEETGNIDIHYLNYFSSTGTLSLIELYERNPHIPGLKDVLKQRKEDWMFADSSWQSKNLMRDKLDEKLKELDL